MPDTRELLHDAAPSPVRTPDFGHLWDRGRRRRRVLHGVAGLVSALVLGVAAVGVSQLVRPADRHVEFVDQPAPTAAPDDIRTPPPTDSAAPVSRTTVVVGDAAFDVPATWPIYGDDGEWEYRMRHCELGQIGPAVFIPHSLPSRWSGCRAVLLGHATGLEVVTAQVAGTNRRFTPWFDEASTAEEIGGQPVTRWEQDANQGDEWTLLRFERLGVYARARTDINPGVIRRILRTFRSATVEDRAADEARQTVERAELAREDWELAERWIGPIPPAMPQDTPRASIAGNVAALDKIQGHFEAFTAAKMQGTPFEADGSRSVSVEDEEAFTVVSDVFNRCSDTDAGPVESAPARPAPDHLQHYRRVSIRPRLDTIGSCSDWFAVDVYVDARDNVKGATLDHGRP